MNEKGMGKIRFFYHILPFKIFYKKFIKKESKWLSDNWNTKDDCKKLLSIIDLQDLNIFKIIFCSQNKEVNFNYIYRETMFIYKNYDDIDIKNRLEKLVDRKMITIVDNEITIFRLSSNIIIIKWVLITILSLLIPIIVFYLTK